MPDPAVALLGFEEAVPLESLNPAPYNPRVIDAEADARLDASLAEYGVVDPVVARKSDRLVIGGHQRIRVEARRGSTTVPVRWVECSDATAKALNIVLNNPNAAGAFEEKKLAALLEELRAAGARPVTGYSESEVDRIIAEARGGEDTYRWRSLADRFGVPPFSVLDARRGYWQDRKRAWLSLGIRSELGRAAALTVSKTSQSTSVYAAKRAFDAKLERKSSWEEFFATHPELALLPTTSIFDPVLCELAVRWFCPKAGKVLDPFAGGSVRGVVAATLGRAYYGVDLSEDQLDANRDQWGAILPRLEALPLSSDIPAGSVRPSPLWLRGDSRRLDALLPSGESFDLVFTCPPYYDLERYSEDPADLSNLHEGPFDEALREVLVGSLARLRPDRFLVLVTGNSRRPDGSVRDLGALCVRLLRDAGAMLYNEAVLVTALSSLPIRAGRYFQGARKLGRTHQEVLVFVKGDPAAAVRAVGEVDFAPPEEDPDALPAEAPPDARA